MIEPQQDNIAIFIELLTALHFLITNRTHPTFLPLKSPYPFNLHLNQAQGQKDSRMILLLLLLVCVCQAVYLDEAFRTDWHIPGIGFNLVHRSVGPYGLISASESGIFARSSALDDGMLVWRHALESSPIGVHVTSDDTVATIDEFEARLWNITSGYLILSAVFSEKTVGSALIDGSLYLASETGEVVQFSFKEKKVIGTVSGGFEKPNFSKEGLKLFVLDGSRVYTICLDSKIETIDLTQYSPTKSLKLHYSKWFYLGDGLVNVLDLVTGKVITTDYTEKDLDSLDLNSLIRVSNSEYYGDLFDWALSLDENSVLAVLKSLISVYDSEFAICHKSFAANIKTQGIKNVAGLFETDLYVALEYSNGDVVFIKNGLEVWKKDTSLSRIIDYAVFDPQEGETLEIPQESLNLPKSIWSAFVDRWSRHFKQLDHFITGFKLDWSLEILAEKIADFGWNKKAVYLSANGNIGVVSLALGEIEWRFDQAQKLVGAAEPSSVSIQGDLVHAAFGDRVIVLRSDAGTLQGVLSAGEESRNGYFVAEEGSLLVGYHNNTKTWEFRLEGRLLKKSFYEPNEHSAKPIGTILGDRSVLYKYLYPNVVSFGVLEGSNIVVYIIDGVSGRVLKSVSHSAESVDVDLFGLVLGENYLVYSFFSAAPVYGSKLHVIEMYESSEPDTHTYLEASGNVSVFSQSYMPFFRLKAYNFPLKTGKLALTRTRFDVSTANLIVRYDRGILAIPKYVVSLRRVEGRALSTSEKNEYMMIPYDPNIGVNSNGILNHQRVVLGEDEEHLFSVPTNLESTTFVCYFGGDLFCTRFYPSLQFDMLSEAFSKWKLVMTVAGVLVAYLASWRMVESKRVRGGWIDYF